MSFRSRLLHCSETQQMAAVQATVSFKILNGVFFNTLISKGDEMRFCGGKWKSKLENIKFKVIEI